MPPAEDYAAVFAAARPEGCAVAARPGLAGELEAHLAAGRAAWPRINLDARVLVRFLATHTKDDLPPQDHAGDLYLACACAAGAKGAADAFDKAFGADMTRSIRRIDATPSFVDEASQRLREKLFVAVPPKIAGYAGRAPLSRWVSAAASRTAMNLRRDEGVRGHDTLHSGARAVAKEVAPEADYLQRRHKEDFEAALRASLKTLTTRERALLRLALAERMSIDQLADVYRVGRSTAARWLSAAKTTLHDRTRDELRARLRVTPSELKSIAAVVRSQIDVSVIRLLKSDS